MNKYLEKAAKLAGAVKAVKQFAKDVSGKSYKEAVNVSKTQYPGRAHPELGMEALYAKSRQTATRKQTGAVVGVAAGVAGGEAIKKNLEKKADETNKYLEKVSGITSTLGKFGKNLTGETVRSAKKAKDMTDEILASNKSMNSGHERYMDQFKGRDLSSTEGDYISRAHRDHSNQSKGSSAASNAAFSHIPFTTQKHVDSAIKSMHKTRAITGAVVGAGAVGVGAKVVKGKMEKKANVYLEKLAGLKFPSLGSKAVGGVVLGAATGASVAGEDNRMKGALAGAAAGGVAGSLFGRAMKPKISNVFGPGVGPGSKAKFSGIASIVPNKALKAK